MSYGNTYEAVYDLYDSEAGWEEMVHVGGRDGVNLGEEALGRNCRPDPATQSLLSRRRESGP